MYLGITITTHIDLIVRPCIHTQRFDLGDMCAQLAMQRRTSHADKDSNLFMYSDQYILSLPHKTKECTALHVCMNRVDERRTFQLAHPIPKKTIH